MIKNFFKTAFRNLWRHKGFTAIHIIGLSLGVAAFLVIANYLRFEYSYDDYNTKLDRIYRVPMVTTETGGKAQTFAFTFPAVGPALKKDFPEIEEMARFRKTGGIVYAGDQKFLEKFGDLFFVDPAALRIFSWHFLSGDSSMALSGLDDAIITESAARKFFGKINPIGQTLRLQGNDFVVRAVLSDLPAASHIQFEVLLNYQKYIQIARNFGSDASGSWHWSDFYTYVLLKKGTDVGQVRSRLPAFVNSYLGDDMKKHGYSLSFALEPLKDIHLRSTYDYEFPGNGERGYLKYLGIAALFLLGIAWINYINLSTARAIDRSREVGVRKVVGASKGQLIGQFLSETFMLNLIAILLGWLLFRLSMPWFSLLVEKSVVDLLPAKNLFWGMILLIFLAGTLLAGFYPSFVLSSFQPVQTLKPGYSAASGGGRQLLRKSLVVLQFTAAIVLIASAIGFYRQLHYMQQVNLGIDIRQTLVLQQTARQDSSRIAAYDAFIHDLKTNPGIRSVTASTSVPGGEVGGSSDFNLLKSTAGKRCRVFGVDDQFFPSYGLTILAGRGFDHDHPASDTGQVLNIVLNETAAHLFGFSKPEEAIGADMEGAGFRCRVIGVLGNYHQESLRNTIDPIVFYPEEKTGLRNFSLKLDTKDLASLMNFTRKTWARYFPESPFSYFFLDQHFNEQYRNDRIFAETLWIFTGLAIVIACLGLFGLSLYTIGKRSREISVRKVLGASVLQICSLVGREYLRLVLLAAIIALPLSRWILGGWIQQYAFRIVIGWWFIVWPLAGIAAIAVLTVLYQSVRAATANPVKFLRGE